MNVAVLLALASAAVGTAMLAGALVVLFHERASQPALMYFLACSAASVWLLGYAGGYVSSSAEAALPYIRAGRAAVALIPPALLSFTVLLLRRPDPYARFLVPCWTLSLVFAGAALVSDTVVATPHAYPWGYYLDHGWLGTLSMLFLLGVFGLTLYLLWTKQNEPASTWRERRRARLLLVAFAIGYLAVLDFLPVYGVPLYPVGFAPVLVFVSLMGYVTWRYDLTPITATLAARQIVDAINDVLIVLDEDGIIRVLNPRARQLLMQEGAAPEGRAIGAVLPELDFQRHRRALATRSTHEGGELRLRLPTGDLLDLSISVSRRQNFAHQAPTYVYLLRDVTKRKVAERHLAYLANHDSLTGLPNRHSFQTRLQRLLAGREHGRKRTALLLMDVDGFKVINDSLGHALGDKLLVELSRRLTDCVCPRGTVARLGGDEFVALIERIDDRTEAETLASRIIEAVAAPFRIAGNELFVTVSIGITIYPDDGERTETLLTNADMALYRSKEIGSNSFESYSDAMNRAALERLRLSSALRHALEREEFSLVYQPKQQLADGRIVGAEALLRWDNAALGRIPPDRFIPVLEESGLILPVGRWILREVAWQAGRWAASGHPMRVSVNVSARQFHDPTLLECITEALHEAEITGDFLELEITESLLVENTRMIGRTLERLKERGMRIAIDDFGTGYSSLSYLKAFPIDTVKIDKAFIQGVTSDPDDEVIAHAVVAMSHSLRMRVVAEGVETETQRAWLKDMGCDDVQGYAIAHPMSAEGLTSWLAGRSTGRATGSRRTRRAL